MQTDPAAFERAIRSAQNGDAEAERRLVEENLPLVAAIASRYKHRGVETEDLRQIGSIGLLKAIRRFDISYGVCFSTYAVPLIAGEIKRFLRDDGMIGFSRNAKQLAAAVAAALEKEPDLSIDELSERLNVTREDLAVAAASAASIASLDEPLPDGSGNLFDRLGEESEEENSVRRLSLDDAIRTLSEREQVLLRMRYREERSQTEIGKALGVSQVQVSRLEKKILSKLRDRIRD